MPQNHGDKCTESFYQEQVIQHIKSEELPRDSRIKMMEMLKRVAQQDDDLAASMLDDNDGSDGVMVVMNTNIGVGDSDGVGMMMDGDGGASDGDDGCDGDCDGDDEIRADLMHQQKTMLKVCKHSRT